MVLGEEAPWWLLLEARHCRGPRSTMMMSFDINTVDLMKSYKSTPTCTHFPDSIENNTFALSFQSTFDNRQNLQKCSI